LEESNVIARRHQKAVLLKEEGLNLYPNTFRPSIRVPELRVRFEEVDSEALEKTEDVFKVAGRIIAKRDYGKSVFFDILDDSAQIQAYIRRQGVSSEKFELFKNLDIGDIVGLSGQVFRTRSGELTLNVGDLELVTKSLLPLPEKYHEINVEMKYRQRYVDLIMNERARQIFATRSQIVALTRQFFTERSFIEVETPMMQPIPGGATAKPFETHHQALDMKLYLRVAPELYLKRLLVGGFDRVFELNRNFRNEGISTKHNPEFTMLEFYQSYADYEDLMDLTEELIVALAHSIAGGPEVTCQGDKIDLTRPWARKSFLDSLVEIGQVPVEVLKNREAALNFCHKSGLEMSEQDVHGKLLAKIFDEHVEPLLKKPTFITNHPTDVSPLARRNELDPAVTDRFELFIGGREMANGFSELNDPLDQQERFLAQVAEREGGDEEAQFMDEDYVRALKYGMPPAAGEGLGIDRLVMLFTDVASIRDVILFPHMRPER